MSADTKIIAVVGATGAQGGGLARAVLADKSGGFGVRALTRQPGSDKARALAELGAEVVEADLDDLDSVTKALEGAYGAYCVTNFWEHLSPEKEVAQAANLAEAASKTGLSHVIWSTLEDTRKWVPLDDDRMPTLMGKYKVPHFDAKGEADGEFSKRGVPTTFLVTSFYWDNLLYFGMEPRRGEDGKLAFVLPLADKLLPGIAAIDIGRCAYGVFKAGGDYIGKRVGIAGGMLTGAEMAAALGHELGEAVTYVPVAPAVYRGFGFPGAEDLGNMFQFQAEFNDDFCGARSLKESKLLNPELLGFEAWLAANKDRIPKA